jgi:hypothetical protein
MASSKNSSKSPKISKKARAVLDQVSAGAQIVVYSGVMGGSSYYLRVNGVDSPINKIVAYQINLGDLQCVSRSVRESVWAARK